MRERETNEQQTSKLEESFRMIVERAETFLPMIGHRYLLEDPANPGAGVVIGHVISDHGEKMRIPLGIVSPDGKAYTFFTEISKPE